MNNPSDDIRIMPRPVPAPRVASAQLDTIDTPISVQLQSSADGGSATRVVVRSAGQQLGEVSVLRQERGAPRFVLSIPGIQPLVVTSDGNRRLLSLLVNALYGSRWVRP